MDNTHTNPAFDFDIKKMDSLLMSMETRVNEQLDTVCTAFLKMDISATKLVRQRDAELNELGDAVEEQTTSVFAKHHPVAEDLRHTISVLKMSIEYERMGDYIKHLAKSIGRLATHEEPSNDYPQLVSLMKAVQRMLATYLSARRDNDIESMIRVWRDDQQVDHLCSESIRVAYENEKQVKVNAYHLIQQISVAKNLERIGDKVKNLVEIYYRQKKGEALDIHID